MTANGAALSTATRKLAAGQRARPAMPKVQTAAGPESRNGRAFPLKGYLVALAPIARIWWQEAQTFYRLHLGE